MNKGITVKQTANGCWLAKFANGQIQATGSSPRSSTEAIGELVEEHGDKIGLTVEHLLGSDQQLAFAEFLS